MKEIKNTDWNYLILSETIRNKLTLAYTCWHQTTPTDTSWHQTTPTDINWTWMTLTLTHWHWLTLAYIYSNWPKLTRTGWNEPTWITMTHKTYNDTMIINYRRSLHLLKFVKFRNDVRLLSNNDFNNRHRMYKTHWKSQFTKTVLRYF